MSTRSQIKLKETHDDIYIYKHCDGYPEGVLPTLKPFVDKFIKERGYDPEYLLAQIVRCFAVEDYKRAAEDTTGYGRFSEFTGWGLDRQRHGDIEYLYEIDSNGDIYVNGELLTDEQYEKYNS